MPPFTAPRWCWRRKPLKPLKKLMLGFGLLWGVMGCTPAVPATAPTSRAATPTLRPTPTLVTQPPTPVVTPTVPPPDSGWELLRPGLEQRTQTLLDPAGERVVESMRLYRIDPAFFQFDVGYAPGEPRTLSTWLAQEGALLVVNGGYFTADFVATGLVIADGVASGSSYGEFAGMVAIGGTAVDIRWLAQQPYQPGEGLRAGLQSFPLLVKPGGVLGFPADADSGQKARRTVIGQDTSGRILLILAPLGHFTLHALSRYLVESDLQLNIALNLDGGPSTGLLLAEPRTEIPAFSGLPTVLLVYPRE